MAFLSKPIDQHMLLISNIRGGKIMYSAIQIGSVTQKWMGLFIPLDVLIGVKVYIGEQECMILDVQDNGRLIFTPKENNLFRFCLHKEVRVIANDGSN